MYQEDLSGMRVNVHQKENDSTRQIRVDAIDDNFATNINNLHVTQALICDRFVCLGVMADTVFEVLVIEIK